jgi:phosphatidylinositol alpha-1,6-mannosyltransferase
MLKSADLILSVSSFTKKKLEEVHSVNPERITILHNTIDPYFTAPSSFEKPEYLLEKLGISDKTKVILTVSRLSSLEKYKGYDKIIEVIPEVKREFPDVKYINVGKGDNDEIRRIEKLIDRLELQDHVTLTGYVGDEELQDYYMISDVFVLPSTGEGFGVVLIEALACGKDVIAGNKDASSEALLDGELGTLVDPDNLSDIKKAIIKILKKELNVNNFDKILLQRRVLEQYGFIRFKQRLLMILKSFAAH